MRKFGTFVLAVILFVSLLGLALSESSNLAFTHPEKVKKWLNQSNLYGNVITDAVKQAQLSGDNSQSISLSDPAIQKIARSTFSSQLLQKNVDTVVDSNYAWLEGKSSTPDFRVDLTSAKQTFAQKVGEEVQSHLSSLPKCTTAQLPQVDTSNPLALQCRPASTDPEAVGSEITDEITNSNAFLNDPVITAGNLNPKGDNESQPYYQNLSELPAVYQFGTKLPLIAGLVAFASLIGVIFTPKSHRNGIRVASIVLVLSGLMLIAIKFISKPFFDIVHGHFFHASNNNQVQQAVLSFLRQAESQLAKTEFWFGVIYLLLGVTVLVVLRRTAAQSVATEPTILSDSDAQTPVKAPVGSKPLHNSDDLRLKPRQNTAGSAPQPSRRPPKPPRLIQ